MPLLVVLLQDGYYMVLVQEFCSGGNVLNLLRNYGAHWAGLGPHMP